MFSIFRVEVVITSRLPSSPTFLYLSLRVCLQAGVSPLVGSVQEVQGLFTEAHPRGPPICSGMYTLKSNERKKRTFFRGSGMPPEGEGCEKLGNYRPPWEDDEDFEEEDGDFDGNTEEANEEKA